MVTGFDSIAEGELHYGEHGEGTRIMATVDIPLAQTIGRLVEGQRKLGGRIDKLESKLDKLLWANFGLIGAVLAGIASILITTLS